MSSKSDRSHRLFRGLRGLVAVLVLGATAVLAACSDDTSTTPTPTPDATLTVYGAGSALTTTHAAVRGQPDEDLVWGDAAVLNIKLYTLYVSRNADCSSPTLAQDLGPAGQVKDFMTGPVLFEAAPADGSYPCVMFKMSDVIGMKPATSFGACVAGQTYEGDIYRAENSDNGDTPFVNVDMTPITPRGTEEAPVDDRVTLFFSRDPAAVVARGASEHQVLALATAMVVPGRSTFVMDATGAVATNGTFCGIQPPAVSFR